MSTLRVLVVDDDIDFRTLLRLHLSREHDIEVVDDAADGFEALEKVDEVSPDAVVVDLMMPGMDGFELIGRLQQRDHVPGLVAYSAMANDAARAEVARLGVSLVTKSGDLSPLVAAVRAAGAAAPVLDEGIA